MNHPARIHASLAEALKGFSRRAAMAMLVVEISIVVGCSAGCSATDDRSASWEYISPALFQPNCATASCHSRATAVAGLDFSDGDRGYTSLTGLVVLVGDPTGVTPVATNPRPLLTPFIPEQSRVVNMLRARDAPRMPPDRPLSEADIRLVERWILNGAPKTIGGNASDGGSGKDSGAPSDAARDATRDAAADAVADAGSEAGTDAASDRPDAAVADTAGDSATDGGSQ